MKQIPDIFPKGTGSGMIPFRDPQQAIEWLSLVAGVSPVSILTQYRGQITQWEASKSQNSGWGCVPLRQESKAKSGQ